MPHKRISDIRIAEAVAQIRREKHAKGETFDEIDLYVLARKRFPHLRESRARRS
jgi:hypothetical protein